MLSAEYLDGLRLYRHTTVTREESLLLFIKARRHYGLRRYVAVYSSMED